MHRKRISISKFRRRDGPLYRTSSFYDLRGNVPFFTGTETPEQRSIDELPFDFHANDSSRRGYFICVERKEGEGEGRKGVRNEARKEGKIDRESWRRLARCDVRKKKHCDENVTTSPVVDDRLSGARERGGTFRATSCLFGDIRHGP